MRLVVRGETETVNLVPVIREEIISVRNDQPITEIKTIKDFIRESTLQYRTNTGLLGVFAILALIIAGLGIYGVVSCSVSQRTRELGIRLALGARRGNVLSMVILQGMKLSAIGLAIGVAGGLVLLKIMQRFLYEVSAIDLSTYICVMLLLAGTALAACYLPARRAAGVDPVEALRY